MARCSQPTPRTYGDCAGLLLPKPIIKARPCRLSRGRARCSLTSAAAEASPLRSWHAARCATAVEKRPWRHSGVRFGLPCAQAAAPSTVFMPRVCSGSASRVPSPCGWAGTSRSPRSSSRCCSTCMKWHLARVIRGPGGTCMLLARQAILFSSLTPLKPYNTLGRLPSAPLYPPPGAVRGRA